jgi:hypothetical protein
VEADGLRLGEDLEGTNEQGAVRGGGGAARRCVAASEVAGDGEEAPEAAHPGLERRVRLGDSLELRGGKSRL